jgi:hypothetical protein
MRLVSPGPAGVLYRRFCRDVRSIRSTVVEIPTERIVFASDYLQETRNPGAATKWVGDIQAGGAEGQATLSGNVGLLLKSYARIVGIGLVSTNSI